MKKKKTARGFDLYEFKDTMKEVCTIQESSISGTNIWFGYQTGMGRMLLNQKQVAKIIPILQKFVETGEI